MPHPAKLQDIAINLFWHAKYYRSPANVWLREVVIDLFANDAPAVRKARARRSRPTMYAWPISSSG